MGKLSSLAKIVMTSLSATVEAVLIANTSTTFVTNRVAQVDLDLGGIPGDRHYGLTRKSGAREPMYPRGTQIRNRRQLSLVSAEECQQIAEKLGIESVLPEWLGANVLVQGLPDLTQLPTGSRLLFPSGAGLVCEGENMPCKHPGQVIQMAHPNQPQLIRQFVRAAQHRRGIICSVERSGAIVQADAIRILLEPQPAKVYAFVQPTSIALSKAAKKTRSSLK
jgi:hypothetical protein